ncbi:hypothetical protein DFH08DRAFT_315747 [Mycena albidolilacea]|uniref:Uncharacterized protein n=1 Tax=Mycena albidolilacea TaxID=1033008 RepID=A0AAD6ZMF0_9AGAR|nr:hypothetical protein DFH08DRAFT_315747 [Mycena albidolilacea]
MTPRRREVCFNAMTSTFVNDDDADGTRRTFTLIVAPPWLNAPHGSHTLTRPAIRCPLRGHSIWDQFHALCLSSVLVFQEKQTNLSQRVRLAALCSLFCFCTVHSALGMRGLYIAFFVSDLPPDTFYLDHTEPLDLSGKAVYAAATVIADCLLIFRAYTVFSRSWKAVLFPCLSLATTLGSWIALIHAYS